MRRFALVTLISICCGVAGAYAQDTTTTVVSYVEVSSTRVDAAKALLTRYGGTCKREDGNSGVKVLQEIGRPVRFAVVEVWNGKETADRHRAAAGTREFREALKSLQVAPPDDRIGTALVSGNLVLESTTRSVYVLTHVDVAPEHTTDGLRLLSEIQEASHRDQGNLSYEIIQQMSRPNHFTVIEMWSDMESLQAHAVASHSLAFRNELQPIEGALYDERLYRALP